MMSPDATREISLSNAEKSLLAPLGNILVTGLTGFIGRHLAARIIQGDGRMHALVRATSRGGLPGPPGTVAVRLGDLTEPESLRSVCQNVDSLFHLAGYAHAQDADNPRAADVHHSITVDGTRALISEAVRAGVRRVIFASSVKAMGEGGDRCLDESAMLRPETSYGRARRDAEMAVLEAGEKHGMHVVVLRLPLVYGAGVKGNLRRMIEAVDRRRFPPIPEVGNKRSMVDVRDVVQALLLAAGNARASGQVYIVTDGYTYSTRQIYEWMAAALGRPLSRWTVPLAVLRTAAKVGDIVNRVGVPAPIDTNALEKLLGSACYSSGKIQRDLGFRAAYRFPDVVPEMVAAYRNSAHV